MLNFVKNLVTKTLQGREFIKAERDLYRAKLAYEDIASFGLGDEVWDGPSAKEDLEAARRKAEWAAKLYLGVAPLEVEDF